MTTTNAPTRPKLIAITYDGPVRAEHPRSGVVWTVQPEVFEDFIERVNRNNAANEWIITPL